VDVSVSTRDSQPNALTVVSSRYEGRAACRGARTDCQRARKRCLWGLLARRQCESGRSVALRQPELSAKGSPTAKRSIAATRCGIAPKRSLKVQTNRCAVNGDVRARWAIPIHRRTQRGQTTQFAIRAPPPLSATQARSFACLFIPIVSTYNNIAPSSTLTSTSSDRCLTRPSHLPIT